MFFRRPFYVPTRVQSKQAEMPMQRLLTEGEMHPNNMAVFPCREGGACDSQYSGLTLNQYGVASPCRTICTVCGFVALS